MYAWDCWASFRRGETTVRELPSAETTTAMCGGARDGRPVLAGPRPLRRPSPPGGQHAVHRCGAHGLLRRAAPRRAQHRARAVLGRE
eukprot:12978736-Heterocapsa_arctica.AAC.1